MHFDSRKVDAKCLIQKILKKVYTFPIMSGSNRCFNLTKKLDYKETNCKVLIGAGNSHQIIHYLAQRYNSL